MFTGPVGPVEVIFNWPKVVFGNFYWPGAIGLLLASSPDTHSHIDAVILFVVTLEQGLYSR